MIKIELLPILWFGNKPEYLKSDLRIVTVGLNPSDQEFRLKKNDSYSLIRFPNFKDLDTLDTALNEYFEKIPYSSWFDVTFEPILNGMEASYYTKSKKRNRAIHTDICSPWATNPTWSYLSEGEKQELYSEGHQQWIDLIKELMPDVIVISVAKKYLIDNFKSCDNNWSVIKKDKNGNNRKNYIIKKYNYQSNDIQIPVVFGLAAQMPFGTISKEQKIKLGTLLYNHLLELKKLKLAYP